MNSSTPHNPPGIRMVTVDAANLADHPQAICFINPKHPTFRLKRDWLLKRFEEGLKIRLLYEEGDKRPAGFIEYVPGENCWRAVDAPGYLFVHCVWVSSVKHRGKGYGSALLQECIRESEAAGMAGVAVMTSTDAFMAGHELFLKNGFTEVAAAGRHYRLLARQNRPGPWPAFRDWEAELRKLRGLHIIWSPQCPWVGRFVEETGKNLAGRGIQATLTEITTPAQAQKAPSPYAVFNLVKDGRLLAGHYISATRLDNILRKEGLITSL